MNRNISTIVRYCTMAACMTAAIGACGGDRGESSPASSSTLEPAASGAPAASAPLDSAGSGSTAPGPKPDVSANPLTGSWSGTYRAKKAAPSLDPGVKVKAWTADDGARGTGQGELRMQIGEQGEVGGSLDGPLGPATLDGTVEGTRVVATIVPRGDEAAGFHGLLEGELEKGSLVVRIRAADAAAELVREGEARLAR